MTISKQALELIGCTVEDYLHWCKDNGFPSYKENTKKEFFKRINENRIVRDTESGLLINQDGDNTNNELNEE